MRTNNPEKRSKRLLKKAGTRPDEAREDLPEILELLAARRREVRMNAAWTVGLVVRSHPETIPEVLPRLVPHLRDERCERETARVLAYIADEFRNWTRTAIEETYSAERQAGVGQFLSQLEDPDAEITPEDVTVLELLSDGSRDRARRGRSDPDRPGGKPSGGRERTGGSRPPDSEGGGWGAGVDRRDRLLLDGIEQASDRLGNVERAERITDGPAVRVYKAIAAVGSTSRGVVIKVLCDSPPGSGFPGRFRDALDRWRHVSEHDGVCPLLDAGRRPRLWFATECLEAGTLVDRDDAGFGVRATVAERLLDTAVYAHSHGVVHGALTPGNVRFTHPIESRQPIPRITDWGVDHVIARAADARRWSPAYAAPEQVDGDPHNEVDQYTDSYQLGACLYRLFTGREPFTGDPGAVRAAVLETPPPPPSDVRSELPAGLDGVLGTAMAKHRASRYETVARLRTALSRVL